MIELDDIDEEIKGLGREAKENLRKEKFNNVTLHQALFHEQITERNN